MEDMIAFLKEKTAALEAMQATLSDNPSHPTQADH
jgi:hypothetical protein